MDQISTPERAQSALWNLINVYGGKVVAMDRYGDLIPAAEREYSRAVRCQEISVAGEFDFDDEALIVMCKLLKVIHHSRLRFKLDLSGTGITSDGFDALKDLTIDTLHTEKTALNPSKLADKIANFRVVNWWLGDTIESDGDLQSLSALSTLRSVGFQIASERVPSPAAIKRLADCPVQRLHLQAPEKQGMVLGKDRLGVLAECSEIYELNLAEFADVDHETLGLLSRSLPCCQIKSPIGVHGWDEMFVRNKLVRESGFTFATDASDAEVPSARNVPAEYDLEFDARRTSVWTDGLGVSVPYIQSNIQSRANFIFGGWDGEGSCIEEVDRMAAQENATWTDVDPFSDGKQHHFKIRVRRNALSADVDGKNLIAWTGFAGQSPPSDVSVDREQIAFLAYLRSEFNVANVKLTPFANQAAVESAEKSRQDETIHLKTSHVIVDEITSPYELTFEIARLSESKEACLVRLPLLQNNSTHLVLGGFSPAGACCVAGECIPGGQPYDGRWANGDPLADGDFHRVKVRVTDRSIEVWVDEKPLLDWRGDQSTVFQTFAHGPELSHQRWLGLEPLAGLEFSVRKIQSRRLRENE